MILQKERIFTFEESALETACFTYSSSCFSSCTCLLSSSLHARKFAYMQNGCYCVISHIYDTRFRFFACHLITEMFVTYNRWCCRCLCRTLHGMEVAWRPGGTDPVKVKILKTKFKALRETTFLHTSNASGIHDRDVNITMSLVDGEGAWGYASPPLGKNILPYSFGVRRSPVWEILNPPQIKFYTRRMWY